MKKILGLKPALVHSQPMLVQLMMVQAVFAPKILILEANKFILAIIFLQSTYFLNTKLKISYD